MTAINLLKGKVPMLGDKTVELLEKRFADLEQMHNATPEEIAQAVPALFKNQSPASQKATINEIYKAISDILQPMSDKKFEANDRAWPELDERYKKAHANDVPPKRARKAKGLMVGEIVNIDKEKGVVEVEVKGTAKELGMEGVAVGPPVVGKLMKSEGFTRPGGPDTIEEAEEELKILQKYKKPKPSAPQTTAQLPVATAKPQRTLDEWVQRLEDAKSKLAYLDPRRIRPNRYNPNVMSEIERAKLLESMKQPNALEQRIIKVRPLKASQSPDGNYDHEIIDGENWHWGSLKLDWPKVKCEINECTELEAMAMCYNINANRGEIDWHKEAKMMGLMAETMIQRDIARDLGLEKSYVSRRLAILELGEENINKAKEKGISVSALEEIAAIKDGGQRNEALDKALEQDEPTVADVGEIVSEATGKKKKKTCPECGEKATLYKCGNGHEWPVKEKKVSP